MLKKEYIDIMDRVYDAYSNEQIENYIQTVKKDLISEHGFPRLTANLGILIANGKRTEYKDTFKEMMDLCCEQIPIAKTKHGFATGNDFSVKEIVFCLLEVEKANLFDKDITDNWRKMLVGINPYEAYSVIAPVPVKPVNNWAAFSAASEQLRKYAGLGDESAFIENQIKSQFFSFDENGMYRDPDEPMAYDTVTRLQLALALYFGFDGESRYALEQELMKSADITLKLQSVTGEIPFGGRSAQFLHNEAHFAALCEYYAGIFKRSGDLNKAGQFKNAARIATESVVSWLNDNKIYHIKNYYDNYSMYGCEIYAYFNKYMVTAASMFYSAYIMADDDIEEIPCPATSENYVCQTSSYFHKTILKYNDWLAEFDTNADYHYDASGLGRLHKKSTPSALCLSVPFTDTPYFSLDIDNPSPFSICGGIKTDKGFVYGFEEGVKYTLISKEVADNFASVTFECKKDNASFCQSLTLFDDYAEITVEGDGNISLLFPAFDTDGESNTVITSNENRVTVSYKNSKCIYEAITGKIADRNEIYANRNGHYKAYELNGTNKITLKITIRGDK